MTSNSFQTALAEPFGTHFDSIYVETAQNPSVFRQPSQCVRVQPPEGRQRKVCGLRNQGFDAIISVCETFDIQSAKSAIQTTKTTI